MILNNFINDRRYARDFRKLLMESFHKRTEQSIQQLLGIPLRNTFVASELRKLKTEKQAGLSNFRDDNSRQLLFHEMANRTTPSKTQSKSSLMTNTSFEINNKAFKFTDISLVPIHQKRGKKHSMMKRPILSSMKCNTKIEPIQLADLNHNLKISKNKGFLRSVNVSERNLLEDHNIMENKYVAIKPTKPKTSNKENKPDFCPWEYDDCREQYSN